MKASEKPSADARSQAACTAGMAVGGNVSKNAHEVTTSEAGAIAAGSSGVGRPIKPPWTPATHRLTTPRGGAVTP